MITIRDRHMNVAARGPAQDVLPERSASVSLERIDFYPTTPDGPAVLGASWQDGSSGICDWLHGAECQRWLADAARTWAAGKIRVHIARGRSVQASSFGDLMGVES